MHNQIETTRYDLPFMTDGLSRPIVLTPTCSGRLFFLQPLGQIFGRHVDEFVELPEPGISVICPRSE